MAAGIFAAVAGQVAGLAQNCEWSAPVLFDGGPSEGEAMCQALARRLGCALAVAPCGPFATALGAARLARDS